MPNQLTDSTTGRTSEWLAKSGSAYVMLVDPATGLPYKASGGGGGGSGFADLLYIDSTGQQFFYQDTGSGLISYKTQNGTYVAYTPVAPVKPYAVAEVTANAGTNLNTSALALESGGNLAALASASSDSAVSGSATAAVPFVVNNTTSKGTLAFTVTGTWTGTIIVEATTDGTNWTPTSYVALASGGTSTTFTANTAGQINVVGLSAVRFRSNTIASGTANFTGNLSRNVSNVMLDNPLPAGSNNIGNINNVTGTVSLPTGAATAALQTALNTIAVDGTQKTSIVQAFTYSPNNSTNGTSTAYSLTTGSTWFGTVEAAINQNYAAITVVSSTAVTLAVYQYLDAAGLIPSSPTYFLAIPANTPTSVPFAVQGNYFKLGVSNASGATSSLIVDTYFGPLPVEPATLTFAGNKKVSVQEQLVSISTLNSSTTQLTAGSTFTGVWEAVLNTASVQVSSICDQATTITVQQAQDAAGTKIVSSKVYTRAAGLPFAESLLVVGTYVRILVQNNGASTTTTFSAQTISTPVMNQSPVGPDNSGNMPVGISQAVYGPTGTNAVFVGGTSQVQVTPAVTAASAYTTGNVIGGLITFSNAVQGTVLSGVLESITLAIKSTQTASFKLYLFSSPPATTFTDKTAPAIGTGDAAKLLDVVSLTGGDSGLGANCTLYVADNIGKSLVLAGTALYGVLTVTGTPTFTTTSDVVVTASILKD